MAFDRSRLPHDYPRRFLPGGIDLADPAELKRLFDELENQRIESRGELERWLSCESELSAALFEEQAFRYILMTCQTDDPAREKDYIYFIEKIEPEVKVRSFALDRKYLASPARKDLPRDSYTVLDRKKENSVALFRPENVELEKEEKKLAQRYQKITGAMTVFYDGRERTMQQMALYLDQPEREVREKAWILVQERRLSDRESINELFEETITVRQGIARNAGFQNYRDYAFRSKERFDYTPEDCFRFHQAVEQHIVPLSRALDKERERKLRVKPLRPWDLIVDPDGRPPLRPFKTATELAQGCARILEALRSEFGRNFRRMADLKLLDLESRPGKAPGGYNYELSELRLPFIFMNAVGRDMDMRTLLHESGHASHTFATRDSDFHFLLRGEKIPAEFAEVASMAMELLGGEHLEGTFYNNQDAVRSKREHLIGIVKGLGWIATIDAFQHWVYTNPGHSSDEREEFWLKLHTRFGGIESWEGYENILRSFWQRQLHLFEYPFYYIEYGIAQLGALGLWTRYLKDGRAAVEAYKRALALGGSKPLPELFRAAELPFDFGPETIEPYAQQLKAALGIR